MNILRPFSATALVLSLFGLSDAAMAQNQVGAAETVQNIVEGDQGGTMRRLSAGGNVFQDETISTREQSGTGIRFQDETTLSVGANSRVRLDRFVYDPNQKTGDIVFSAARGAFRFVTGAAQSSSYRFFTPTAAIGVRGTDIGIYINNNGDSLILTDDGEAVVCPITQPNTQAPGGGCCIVGAGSYGSVMSGVFQCSGPFTWQGDNPFTLLEEARYEMENLTPGAREPSDRNEPEVDNSDDDDDYDDFRND